MGKYIVKRVLQFIPVFLGVTLILFALQNIVPGDPIKLIGGDKALSPEVELQLRVRYHLVQSDEDGNAILDENGDPVQTSLVDRYLYYMNGLLHGDLAIRISASYRLRISLPRSIRIRSNLPRAPSCSRQSWVSVRVSFRR